MFSGHAHAHKQTSVIQHKRPEAHCKNVFRAKGVRLRATLRPHRQQRNTKATIKYNTMQRNTMPYNHIWNRTHGTAGYD